VRLFPGSVPRSVICARSFNALVLLYPVGPEKLNHD